MSKELEDFIHQNKEAFADKTPDPAILARIQEQMLGKTKKKAVLIPMQTLHWAAALVVLMAGATTFWVLQKKPVTERMEMATTAKPEIPVAKKADENKVLIEQPIRSVQDEVPNEINLRKQVLFAKLNDMGSSSERLTAAAEAYHLKNTDNDIVDALVKTMNSDPSTNVRLAALEGLSKFYREGYVRKQLIASLKKQTDPMVQIELIQLLTKMKETAILNELDRIVKDGNTIDAVKDHAYSSIFSLRS